METPKTISSPAEAVASLAYDSGLSITALFVDWKILNSIPQLPTLLIKIGSNCVICPSQYLERLLKGKYVEDWTSLFALK